MENKIIKSEKIYGVKGSLFINGVALIIIPLFCWHFSSDIFYMKNLDKATGTKMIQVGTLVNYISALVMAIRFLWQSRYKVRENQIIQLSEKLDNYYQWSKTTIQTEVEKDKLAEEIKLKQELHYEELRKVYSLDKIEYTHIWLGIAGLTVGTFMQIVGTGAA